MGGISQLACFCCRRDKHMIISLMFLLLSSSTQERFMAEGRFITKNFDANNQVIGSRPPRCERKCDSCGHCEAVQVPVTIQGQGHWRRRRSHFIFSSIAYYRGDDVTNYKPMSWKCKCGNLIFNP